MLKLLLKQFLIITLLISAALSIIFGSYLPLVKSRRYVAAAKALFSVRSIDDFERNFDKVFNFYSPVGDEEVVKFLSATIFDIISGGNQSEEAARALVAYIEPHLFQSASGGNVRHLLNGGGFYFKLWNNYGHKQEDFARAEAYYLKALAIGPKLPPALYSLFQLYNEAGEREKAAAVAGQILAYWPEDEKIREILNL
jgi:tetratricopeptide (TPR) repeat protein